MKCYLFFTVNNQRNPCVQGHCHCWKIFLCLTFSPLWYFEVAVKRFEVILHTPPIYYFSAVHQFHCWQNSPRCFAQFLYFRGWMARLSRLTSPWPDKLPQTPTQNLFYDHLICSFVLYLHSSFSVHGAVKQFDGSTLLYVTYLFSGDSEINDCNKIPAFSWPHCPLLQAFCTRVKNILIGFLRNFGSKLLSLKLPLCVLTCLRMWF